MIKVLNAAVMGATLLSGSIVNPVDNMTMITSIHSEQVKLMFDDNIHTSWHSSKTAESDYLKIRMDGGVLFGLEQLELSGVKNLDSIVVRYNGPGFEEGFVRSYDVVDGTVSVDPIAGARYGLVEIQLIPTNPDKQVTIGEFDYQTVID